MAGLFAKARRWIGTHPIAAMCLLTALCLVVNLLAQWAMGMGFYRFHMRFLARSPFSEFAYYVQPWGLAIWAVLSAAAVSVIRLRAGLSIRPLVIGLLWNVPLCAAASVLLDIVGHKIAGQTDNFIFWFSFFDWLENSAFAAVLAIIISGGHCIGITVSLLYSRYRMRTGKWEMMGAPPTNSSRLPGGETERPE